MKDPHDRETNDILGDHIMKFQVNYKYQATNNKLRTGALILDAEDHKSAQKAATEQLSKELDWFKITATVAFADNKK